MSGNGIIRVSKNTDRFAVLDKYFLEEDSRLSFRAKGLLAYLLAKPDNWRVYVGDLVKRTSDGRTAIYSTLKELEQMGYMKREQLRNEKGTITGYSYTVYDRPLLNGDGTGKDKPPSGKPDADNPELDGQEVGNPPAVRLDAGNPHLVSPYMGTPFMGSDKQINTTIKNKNNDQDQQQQQQQRAISSRHLIADQNGRAKDVVVVDSHNQIKMVAEITAYARDKGIDVAESCARDFLLAAKSIERAKAAIDWAAGTARLKTARGEKINNPAGLLFTGLKINSGARFIAGNWGRNIAAEKDKYAPTSVPPDKPPKSKGKYDDLYLT